MPPIAALIVTITCSSSAVLPSAPDLKLATPLRSDSLWGSAIDVTSIRLALCETQWIKQLAAGFPESGGQHGSRELERAGIP
jgi:hypothetical protein